MTDKQSNLDKALGELSKRYGEDAAPRYGKDIPPVEVEAISTGSLKLDELTGIGGVPRGRITEIFGWEDSAKSTVCQKIIANAQKIAPAAYIDMEGMLDPNWAQQCGVDWGTLVYVQPQSGEAALEQLETLIRSGAMSAVVVDSISTLVPNAEIEGEHGDGNFGMQAKMISAAMRKINPIVKQSGTALIFINQLRTKVGGWTPNPSIVPETTTGGKAMGFYASLRIRLAAKKEEEHMTISVRVAKNKVGGRFNAKTDFIINYDGSIDRNSEIVDLAVEKGIIVQGGAFYQYEDREPKWRGKSQVEHALKSDPALADEILRRIREVK